MRDLNGNWWRTMTWVSASIVAGCASDASSGGDRDAEAETGPARGGGTAGLDAGGRGGTEGGGGAVDSSDGNGDLDAGGGGARVDTGGRPAADAGGGRGVDDAGRPPGTDAGGAADGGVRKDAGTVVDSGRDASALVGPCDIYGSDGAPCVAAHSTVRALYGNYSGNLYQVKRASDNTTKDIAVLTPGGFADASAQDAFCAGTTCTISILYDQSPKANHLRSAPGGGAARQPDKEASATALKLNIGGHTVYGIHVTPGVGYRNNATSGVATGDKPETEYMVTSGTFFNNGCCFDYGNAETNSNDDGNGTMEAVYLGTGVVWGTGAGTGPWVEADLENGLFAGGTTGKVMSNTSLTSTYVTAMVVGRSGSFALKGGNAQSGALTTMYDGARPSGGYNPMKKQGAIILGIGGDNSNGAQGNFFEGVMTAGNASNATDDAVQANIVAVGYGR